MQENNKDWKVSSFNEWDRLEEVIVGTVEGATIPEWHVQLEATMPKKYWTFYKENGGKPFPVDQIKAAEHDLEGFTRILEGEGVTVRRPDPVSFSRPFGTMDWSTKGGLYAAMPRDNLLVIGNEIIESPMSWRSRYYEGDAYKPLLKKYFQHGAKWTTAPKPQLLDESYNNNYQDPEKTGKVSYSITEFEPLFDAADFIRCGQDIFVQLSNTTNRFGIEWLQRHLGSQYTIHIIDVNDTHPMHIDATLLPLAPGKLLINKNRLNKIPEIFKDWEIMEAPEPNIPVEHPLYMTSRWINMNILMLDEKRVVVEAGEENIINAFKKWGFDVITCNFRNFNSFGGSFHCATADIRRAGEIKSYFN